MKTEDSDPKTPKRRHLTHSGGVGGPVSAAWREGTLTRAKELETLTLWCLRNRPAHGGVGRRAGSGDDSGLSPDSETQDDREKVEELTLAIKQHLEAAREAVGTSGRIVGRRFFWRQWNGCRLERATSNLDAAEALLLNVAPPDYLLGQLPSLVNHVQRHLAAGDPRRHELERIAKKLGAKDLSQYEKLTESRTEIENERGKIITAARGASSAALREQLRVRSFRNVLVATTVMMTLLAAFMAVLGFVSPTTIPLCFEPEKSGQTVVVCPTKQSALLPTGRDSGPAAPDVDDAVDKTAAPADLFLVEMIGLIAAAVAAAAALRSTRGSSERYGLPVALAMLKLPTGAITALLGLLLMRGQFVPGLTALDTSGQILAWALVFGYSQQVFTRLVDHQADSVLSSVRGADNSTGKPTSPS